MKKAIISPRIFDGEQFYTKSAILLKNQNIVGVVDVTEIPSEYEISSLDVGVLAPGFIDWQVNGGGGVLFNNDITDSAIETIVQGHHKGGTTSLMPTLISDSPETLNKAVIAVQKACDEGNASVLGLHLEGPFFSIKRRGTHAEKAIRRLCSDDIDWLCSLTGLRIILTLAPEKTNAGQIKTLTKAGIIVNAGHTDATAMQIKSALDEGLRGFTHLYNAMSHMTARDPGVVGAALDDENSWCGIIVDGHHVDPISVRVACAAKPRGKLCLVTDAMATVGSDNDEFELYGTTIKEQQGRLINSEGRLAGSAISMIDAVRTCHHKVGIELDECLRMASLYPAEYLDVNHYLGKIKPGFRADLVHFDDDFRVTQTWVAGKAML